VAELPRGHHVFPFNAFGARLILAWLIAAGFQVWRTFLTLPTDIAAAVKSGRALIDFYRLGLGLTEVIDALAGGEKREE